MTSTEILVAAIVALCVGFAALARWIGRRL
jgi:hypothetical protein